MDNEKLQKTIEFILNNQAEFSVEMQKIQDAHKDAENRIGTLERASLNLYNTAVEQGQRIVEQSGNINLLSTDIKELRESQKETNECLSAVITRFEKFLDNQNSSSK